MAATAATDFNLDDLDKKELKKLKSDVEKAISTLETRKRQEALNAARAQAKEHGFSLEELVGETKSAGKSKLPPKFAHPQDPEQTWTGRGRQPNWYKEYVEAGHDPEDLKI